MADGGALNLDSRFESSSNGVRVPESVAASAAAMDAASDTMIQPDLSTGSGSAAQSAPPAVAPPGPTEAQEVSFINGFTPSGLVTSNSYWEWADYQPNSFKDGSPVLGAGATITFSFDPASNWTTAEKQTMLDAMAQWESVANVTFAEDDNPGDVNSTDLLLHRGDDGGAYTTTNQSQGVGSTPGSPTGQVMISIDTSVVGFNLTGGFNGSGDVGGYGRSTIIHELGHFLGLGHGGPYNGNVTPSTDQFSAYDSREWSIMSYIYWGQTSAKYYSQYPVQANWGTTVEGYNRQASHSLMPLDILAIQQLYGASQTATLSGGQVYGFNTNIQGAANGGSIASTFNFAINTAPVVTLYNSGTGNTLDLSGYSMAQRVDLHAGAFSDVGGLINNVGIAYATKIDTAIGGSGNDSLTANDDGDLLNGNAGTDTLNGGAGDDVLIGGAGADALNGGGGSDTASYQTSTGAVTADLAVSTQNTGDATGDTYNSIENLRGSAYADTLTGDTGDNIIEGGAGADVLVGGGGDDTLSYAHSSSYVFADLRYNSFTRGDAEGDNATGFSNLIGSAFNDSLRGNNDFNVLDGGDGDDDLVAIGSGDTLIGGAGSDNLNGTEGSNVTASYVTATVGLTADLYNTSKNTGDASGDIYQNIANLTGSAFNDTLIGDTHANVLTGGVGDDTLSGMGGGDTFIGGDGSDTVSYAWSSSAVTADLADSTQNTGAATGDSYDGVENLTGTTGNDTLTGDSGDNVFIGGAGSDSFTGGGGNDTVSYANSSTGVQIGLTNGGTTSFANLGDAQGDSFASVSNLIGSSGNDVLYAYFDPASNILDGGAGDDQLDGSNGDTLIGGTGADTFYAQSGSVTVSYITAASGVVANLSDNSQNTGDAAGDVYTADDAGVLNLAGSAYSDSLTGNNSANVISGGAGDDLLTGLLGDDTLNGGDGDDTLDGGAGADTLDGGAGNNVATYRDASAAVTVSLANPNLNTGDAAGDSYSSIENVEGSGFNDTLTGDTHANILDGGDGDDTFFATGGGDTFIGGDGNDTVSYANATSGVDAALDYSGYGGFATGDMFNGVENLIGSAYDDSLETSVNGGGTFVGGAGSDTFYADGNNDTLIGGAGGDYFVNDYPDYDIVNVSYATSTQGITLNLADDTRDTGDAAGDSFYDQAAGESYADPGTVGFAIIGTAYHDHITGDDGDNILNGGGGDDTLLGGNGDDILIGGAGNDTMYGGNGNDTYYVINASDIVKETINGGYDTIVTTVSYSLSGLYVEAMTLAGSNAATLTGNNLANALTGNSAANTLIGNGGNDVLDGGQGADVMNGGDGNDTYYVDNAGDNVIESSATGGTDKIYSTVSYSLKSRYVETLTLTGSGAINATGNDQANTLVGNAGANVLDGAGGSDKLTGGAGADTFEFSSAIGVSNVDTITDFTVGQDMIQLDRSIFYKAGADGALSSAAFGLGMSATTTAQRIIYDATTGDLFYDADGSGSGAQVQIATLSKNLALTASSFTLAG